MSDRKSMAGVGPFGNTSIEHVAAAIREGELSASEVVDGALKAINEFNPELNCFVTVDDSGARHAARIADEELAAGLDRGPLHGIPVGVKDLISTSGVATTMGSRHFAKHRPVVDAEVVSSLRRAGAVILGKTHTHEFAYGTTGDKAASGPSRNPHDSSLMAGGSSGGSAAAVAAGLVPLALGTDTAGSVRIPAALCGVTGLRPTTGSVDGSGVFPLSSSFDVVGPIGANIFDTSVGWWALNSGPDSKGAISPEWSSPIETPSTNGSRLRFARVEADLVANATAGCIAALQSVVELLGANNSPVTSLSLPEVDLCAAPFTAIQSAEAFANHRTRVEQAPELFEPEVLERLRVASQVSGWEYVEALRTRDWLATTVVEKLTGVDILLMPTVPIDTPKVGQRELPQQSVWQGPRDALLSMSVPWSLLGYPALSLPVSTKNSVLPRSVQLIAKPGHERELLLAASFLEGLQERAHVTGQNEHT